MPITSEAVRKAFVVTPSLVLPPVDRLLLRSVPHLEDVPLRQVAPRKQLVSFYTYIQMCVSWE